MIQIHQDNWANLARLEAMLEDDPVKHIYRLDRSAFTDEQLFELEMKYIFEGNWVYLAHESQIPNVNDYLTVYIGRQPVVITRSKDGKLNALANTCTHRGAILCRHKKGNKSSFTCPFHGWTFSNTGKLLKVKDNSARGRLSAELQLRGQPRPEEARRLRELSRLPVRQRQPGRRAARRSTWARRPRSST